MRWLDANGIKRIEFSQCEVLLYIIKKYKLNMKYRAAKLAKKVEENKDDDGLTQINELIDIE